MGIGSANPLLLATAASGGDTDPVTRSLRFNGSVSSSEAGHLYRTAGTPTDEGKWTMSMWVKVGQQPSNGNMALFGGGSSNDNNGYVGIRNGELWSDQATSSNHRTIRCTGQVLRDPNAWYHLCFAYDNSQTGSSGNNQNAYKWYVNGVRLTEPTYSHNESVTGYIHRFNSSGYVQRIGKNAHRSYHSTYKYHWDGLIANVHFVDGQQLEPTEFIESNDYGGYKPKEYTGTYGNNGFHIDAQTLGSDAELLVTSIDRNDGDTLFADVAKGRDVNVRGTHHHSIAVGNPFTGNDKSIYWNNTEDCLQTDSSTDFALGTDDCTIEFWFNAEFSGSWQLPIASSDTSYGPFIYITASKYIAIYQGANTSWWTSPNNTVKENQWQHFAFCRKVINGTTYNRVWVDGKEISPTASASTTYSWSWGTSAQSIKIAANNYDNFKGYLHDVRIIKGTAAYWGSGTNGAGDITVPATKLTAVTNTKLLIQPTPSSDSSWSDIDKSGVSGRTISHSDSVAYADPTASTPYDSAAKSTAIRLDSSSTESFYTETNMDFAIGSSDTFTAEGWFYVPSYSAYTPFFSTRHDGSADGWQLATTSDAEHWSFMDNGGAGYTNTTVDLPPAGEWFHLAIVKNSNSTDGVSIYVNGALKFTATSTSNRTTASTLAVGDYWPQDSAYSYCLNGYAYDIRFSKNETRYSGTSTSEWGNFDEITAPFELNPVYLGGDQSGNKNHFTPTNISSHDVMPDVPTKNYATMSPVSRTINSGSVTFGEGNLSVNSSGTYNKTASTIAMPSGKWYAEIRPASRNNAMVGVCRATDIVTSSDGIGYNGAGHVVYIYNGRVYNGNGTSWTSQAFTSADGDDVVQLAVDVDNLKIWFGLNNTWEGTVGSSGGHSLDAGEQVFAYTYRDEVIWNFGQDPTFANNKPSGQDTSQGEFYYAPPTGFKSLNSSNLDDPTVTPSENFGIALYNGTSSSNAITGLGFQPDLLYTKSRSTSGSSPKWFDSLRGVTKRLETNTAGAETTQSTELTSFDSDGFTLGSDSGSNYSGRTYVGWTWKAHQTASSYSYSNTLTLTVENYDGYDGWGTTKLEVIEGSTSLGFVSEPDYDNEYGGYYAQYDIKTDDVSKIKLVWRTVDSSDPWYDIYAYLENSSSTELASWDGYSYYGGSGGGGGPDAPEEDDVFYPSSGHDSTNASTTGVLELQGSTVNSNSEKYNAAAGFTMFTYTGNSSTDNDMMLFNHSLGAPIDFAIGKCRSSASGSGGKWVVWHKDLANDDGSIYLNESESESDTNGNNYDEDYSTIGWFQNVTAGAQHQVKIRNVLIYDGSNTDTVRMVDNNKNFIFYGFAGVENYSKFGSYTGNGSSDGPFIYTGFRPAFVLIKNIGASQDWFLLDNKREGYNVVDKFLEPNTQNAEATASSNKADFTANGFKLRGSGSVTNQNNTSFVYACFSESPFKHANAR